MGDLERRLKEKKIIERSKKLVKKFIEKVEDGRARSVETYRECKELLEMIDELED